MKDPSARPTGTGTYRVRRVSLSGLPRDVEQEWRAFVETWKSAGRVHEIDWLRNEWPQDIDRVFALLVYDGARLTAVVSCVVIRWPLPLELGELKVLELPLHRLCVLGLWALPEVSELYEAVFWELADTADYDVLFLEMVERGSFLHRFVAENRFLSGRFRRISEGGMQVCHRIRFPATAEEYFAKFSSKTRATHRRKIRKLGHALSGELVVERFDSMDRLSEFISSAVDVSRRSYQWYLLGKGLRDVDRFRRQATGAAKHGWLRGYVLKVGERPVAFMVGYQYKGAFLYDEVGFDQELRRFSPGTVLQLLVIDDLYAHDTPRTFEFGVHGEQKAAFGNETYEAESLFLARRSLYPGLATATYRFWHRTSDVATGGLERLGVKKKVKQLVRRLSFPASRNRAEPPAE